MSQPVNNVSDCALVLEGGGYRGAFTAGIISVLLEEGIQFPYACGLSAGASNVVNYVAGNQKRIPATIDAGAVSLSETFKGRTLMRKADESLSAEQGFEVLQDTNNSTEDFYERETQSLHQ